MKKGYLMNGEKIMCAWSIRNLLPQDGVTLRYCLLRYGVIELI